MTVSDSWQPQGLPHSGIDTPADLYQVRYRVTRAATKRIRRL